VDAIGWSAGLRSLTRRDDFGNRKLCVSNRVRASALAVAVQTDLEIL